MRTVNGLSLFTENGGPGVFIEWEGEHLVAFDVDSPHFSCQFDLSRRSARELRDWLTAALNE